VSARPQLSVRACSWTPAGPPGQTMRLVMLLLSKKTLEAPTVGNISRLDSRAFGLAVYASQRRCRRQIVSYLPTIARPHAKLASGGGQPDRAGSAHKVSERYSLG
jgi:hypothetical protein